VKLNMYYLLPGGLNSGSLCLSNDTRYGCTADPNKPYLLGTQYPISVSIDTTSDIQGYLRNVLAQEFDPGHAASSLRAVAIAARSFTYWEIDDKGTLNNSNSFHVYIPYRFDALSNAADRTKIDQAISGQVYMTPHNNSAAVVHAHYTQDNDTWTAQGTETYLIRVYDPISWDGLACLRD
jgi:hypothetical protein